MLRSHVYRQSKFINVRKKRMAIVRLVMEVVPSFKGILLPLNGGKFNNWGIVQPFCFVGIVFTQLTQVTELLGFNSLRFFSLWSPFHLSLILQLVTYRKKIFRVSLPFQGFALFVLVIVYLFSFLVASNFHTNLL